MKRFELALPPRRAGLRRVNDAIKQPPAPKEFVLSDKSDVNALLEQWVESIEVWHRKVREIINEEISGKGKDVQDQLMKNHPVAAGMIRYGDNKLPLAFEEFLDRRGRYGETIARDRTFLEKCTVEINVTSELKHLDARATSVELVTVPEKPGERFRLRLPVVQFSDAASKGKLTWDAISEPDSPIRPTPAQQGQSRLPKSMPAPRRPSAPGMAPHGVRQ